MNTALYMLRALQIGLSVKDMEELEVGLVMDMIIESGNDNAHYDQVAQQSDFDAF